MSFQVKWTQPWHAVFTKTETRIMATYAQFVRVVDLGTRCARGGSLRSSEDPL